MDLLQHYRQLAGYDEWANREIIASFRASQPTARSLRWLAHIVAAEHLWLARVRQKAAPFAVWPELTVDQCETEVRKLAELWNELLAESSNPLERLVAYKNSKGESYESLVRDILTHVFMHSAYHRGQIASEMRASGQVPAYTDFIHVVRQGLIGAP
jgi:uncharacterized damage-inducible protein DinB